MLAHMVNDGSVYLFAALIPYYTQNLGMSYVQAGLAWTVINLVGSLPQPLLGMIADRLKSFALAGVGLAIVVVFLGPVGYVSDFWAIMALAAVVGIGTATCHPVTASFTAAAGGKRRGMAMSIFSLGGNIGFTMAPLLLPPLILVVGPQASAAIVPVGMLVAVPLLLASRGFKPGVLHHPRLETSADRARSPVLPMVLLVLVAVLRSWVYTAAITFLPIFLTTRGFALTTGAQLLSLMLMMGTVGMLTGGIASDYFSPKWGTILSLGAATALLAAFFATSGIVSIVALALSGFFLLWSMAVTTVMAQKLYPSSQALVSGLTIGLGIGMGAVGVSVTAWMTDVFGIGISMSSLVGVGLIAALLLLPYRETRAGILPEARVTTAGA